MPFRCDNGKAEYDNAVFQNILKEEGITYGSSAHYTQTQNDVSEHMNRTIMENVRSMVLEASLSERFWAEAVNRAVYHHYTSHTRSLEGTMPHEAWDGIKPVLSHLNAVGWDALR